MTSPKVRADTLLVARGFAPTRAKAQAAIAAGGVFADGAPVRKASERLGSHCVLSCTPASRWVSRAGEKLSFALEAFAVSAQGRHCLDIGASTGGFTQVLLAQNALSVVCVDVGQDQLHPLVRADPRVRCLEGLDARALQPSHLLPAPDLPELIVCDASFIGASKALARPFALCAKVASAIVLIKPPYEAGPGVRVMGANAAQIAEAGAARLDGLEGFALHKLAPCAILGGDGSQEFIALLRRGAGF